MAQDAVTGPVGSSAGQTSPLSTEGDFWRCRCGRTTIRLPFKPLLRSICCLEPYYMIRSSRGST